jgi:hypothetical protein
MYGAMTTLLQMLDTHQAAGVEVIGWGCPVPFFGHLESARLATVGINPSNREFVGTDGSELAGGDRRLPTLGSLGLSSWLQADVAVLRAILAACREYFERNPYDGWFGSLQRIIEPTGHSYYAPRSDACHLDVVPWATASKWGTLPLASRRQLARLAAQALADMIASSPLRMLVLNGKEVVSHFEALAGLKLPAQRMPGWDLPRRSGRPVPGLAYCDRISSIAGVSLDRDLLVAGYNHNLQSSFGVTTAVRAGISEWISTQYLAGTW